MTELYFYLRERIQREEGQTLAEYAVVLAVITVAVIGAITLLGGNIQKTITAIAGHITAP